MNYLKLVEKYVVEYYKEFCNDRYSYHSIDHVNDVVNMVQKIGESCNLNNSELEILKIAAWFHDIGHLISEERHEKISANIAEHYLGLIDFPIEKIGPVMKCVRATELNVRPTNILEMIIKDADLFHLGNKKYFTYSNRLFDEIIKRKICTIDYFEWTKSSIKFFEKHRYYTDYAKNLFEKQKFINLEKLYLLVNKNSLAAE